MDSKTHRVFLALFGLVLLLGCAGNALGYSYYHFPQLITGKAGTEYYATQFTITNPASSEISVLLRLYTDAGTAFSVGITSVDRPDIDDQDSSFLFTLQGRETVTLVSSLSSAALTAGWATLMSDLPVLCSGAFLNYHLSGSTRIIDGSVGVLPVDADTGFNMSVAVGSNEPYTSANGNHGVAIANPNGRAANLTLRLYDRLGANVGEKTVAIPSKGHYSRFMSEIFSDYNFGTQFHGQLSISSDTSIAPMSLSMVNGVLTSLSMVPIYARLTQHTQKIEPNDTSTTAQGLHTLPAWIIGTLDKASGEEADFYSFEGHANLTVRITSVARSFGSLAALTVELYALNGNVLLASKSYSAGADPDPIVYDFPATNAYYYIKVHGANGVSLGDSTYWLFVDTY